MSKGIILRSIQGYKSTVWLDRGTIVEIVFKLTGQRYYIVKYGMNEVIIPEDAVKEIIE